MTAILFTAFGACALVPYIFFRCKGKLMPGLLLKAAASVFFLLTGCAAALACPAERFGQVKYLFFGVLIGQVFGLLGDLLLDMKDMYAQHKNTYTFSGFLAFLIGHLFFMAGLLKTYGFYWKYLPVMLGAGLVLIAGVLATEKPLKFVYGKFKGISLVYGAVIAASVAAAFCAWRFGGRSPQALVMFIGLALFLLSDFVLSGTYFGQGMDMPIHYTLNYVLYYGGQFTIALSLLAAA
ncbi:MAG: lysoplasmalogenase [Oscillospiraceae bacterium]|nr:lysoplasmalogenase [Oscillospiraceae bacterium]